MKLSNIKIGDVIETMVTGMRINATVINTSKDTLVIEFAPVTWGDDIYTTGTVTVVSHREFATPHSWFNGEQITKK